MSTSRILIRDNSYYYNLRAITKTKEIKKIKFSKGSNITAYDAIFYNVDGFCTLAQQPCTLQ